MQQKATLLETPPETDEGEPVALSGEKVYLMGPMTGYTPCNVATFATVHALVKECGARVVYDPAIRWLTASPMGYGTPSREDWMREAIHELTRTDCAMPYYDVAVCIRDEAGAAQSPDVALLLAVADACGIWVVDAEELSHERR